MMRQQRFQFLAVQLFVVAVVSVSYASMSKQSSRTLRRLTTGGTSQPEISVDRQKPLRVQPLYDDSEVVSDEELAAVLKQILPTFSRKKTSPNHVEHALRTWGVDAKFDNSDAMSGIEMRDFLIDHARYRTAWGEKTKPLLVDRPSGISVRWGRSTGASVHHDHLLACLTEAGIGLNDAVIAPSGRDMTVKDLLQEAARDFRLDERETEWSAMVFGLWMPTTKTWNTSDGREMSFDRLATRLMRGDQRFGVCSGTHRVYSLMLLLRLDDEFRMLSAPVGDRIRTHLKSVRDRIRVSQFADGHWPSNWSAGLRADENRVNDPDYRKVIATGHHLEWLAIAPREFHPPREQILKAADWLIDRTVNQPREAILKKYTFYSHVGNALALWRGTRPADFWRKRNSQQPANPDVLPGSDKTSR